MLKIILTVVALFLLAPLILELKSMWVSWATRIEKGRIKKTTKHNKGFTMIEVMVLTAIIGIVSSVVFVTISNLNNSDNDIRAEELEAVRVYDLGENGSIKVYEKGNITCYIFYYSSSNGGISCLKNY